jgi:hypothetical protein
MSLLDRAIRLCSRSLSAPGRRTDLARALLIVDGALVLSNPVYSAFAERRHTGKWGRRLGLPNWVQSWRYAVARLCSPRSALFTLAFGSQPQASAAAREREDWKTPGSCVACTTKACCKMKAPWGTVESCPMLRGDGCAIYGGLAWRVGPCGRYPESGDRVMEYGCPRFVYDEASPGSGIEEKKGTTARRPVRLPVVPNRVEVP